MFICTRTSSCSGVFYVKHRKNFPYKQGFSEASFSSYDPFLLALQPIVGLYFEAL
jgi:hypothetical protein